MTNLPEMKKQAAHTAETRFSMHLEMQYLRHAVAAVLLSEPDRRSRVTD